MSKIGFYRQERMDGGIRTGLTVEGTPVARCAWVQSRKPPSNQPQVTPWSLSRSPTLRPPIATASRLEQMSNNGCESPRMVLVPCGCDVPGVAERSGGQGGGGGFASGGPKAPAFPQMTPNVFPLARLSAPGVEGPKPVP